MAKPKMLFFRMLNSTHIGAQTMGETLQMLDMYRDEYDLVAYKKDRGNDVYPVLAGVTQSDWSQAKAMGGKKEDGTINIPTWRRLVEPHLLDFTALNVKQIVLIGGIILPRTVDFRYKVGPDDELAFLTDEWTKATARESFFSAIFPTLQIVLSANKHKVPVHAIIFDPDEVRLNNSSIMEPGLVTSYHGYDSEVARCQRLDCVQYGYLHNQKSDFSSFFDEEVVKDTLFTFGLSINSVQREHVYAGVQAALASLEGQPTNFFMKYKNPKLNVDENTLVPREMYLHHIERSKFTLVVPSYHPQIFSIARFIDALAYDCLPLIGPDVNISEMEASFNIDLKPLVVPYAEIGKKMLEIDEETRINMVEHYKSKVLVFEKKLAI